MADSTSLLAEPTSTLPHHTSTLADPAVVVGANFEAGVTSCHLLSTLTDEERKWIFDPRSLAPVNEPLQPNWRTEIKGYSTCSLRASRQSRVGEFFASNAHCPLDKKMFSGVSKHITPADDTWLARLLRRRLEQDIYETPPEWLAWICGFGWRDPKDPKRVLHDWAQMPLHMQEWRPRKTIPKTNQKPHVFFDLPTDVPQYRFKTDTVKLGDKDVEVIRLPKWVEAVTSSKLLGPALVVIQEDGTRRPVVISTPSTIRFKGVKGKKPFDHIISELKNAPATWVYVHEDERAAKRHGLTDWISRQDKPAINQDERILFRKEYKTLHSEEVQQVKRSHTIKSKRNTGGMRPEGAIEDKDDYLQWMCDKGEAREKSTKEVNQELADQLKEQDWEGSLPMMFSSEGRATTLFGEAASPTSMVWDGDSFAVNDDHPEYFQGRIIPERKRLTGAQRAAEFNDHKALVEAGAVDLREDELILEVKLDYRTREEVAEELGISVDALDKRIQRRDLEARAMQDGKFQIPYLALTYEQAADIADNNAVYLQVDLNGWRWCKLNVEKYGSVAQAIKGLKHEKMWEALRQRKESKAASRAAGKHGTNERYPEWTIVLKEVKDRYDKQVFHPDRIRILQCPPRPKPPWAGLVGDVLGDE